MELIDRINAFVSLGKIFISVENNNIDQNLNPFEKASVADLEAVIPDLERMNPWFKQSNVIYALNALGESLSFDNLKTWLEAYDIPKTENNKLAGVVMAGNLPLVGFHDFLCVLISGNRLLAKMSSQDNKLLPMVSKMLCTIEPRFEGRIEFTEGRMQGFDAIIATGSGNTARYFEYYFGKYPNIIRHNRNAVAVLNGDETEQDLIALSNDVFMHFGLGCRNVSKLFVPKDYNFDRLFLALDTHAYLKDHYKYFNNYEYYKSILLINSIKHFDNGFAILKQDNAIASPISVLYYEYYDDIDMVNNRLKYESENVQCVVASANQIDQSLPFGKAQAPELWDYADGVDTMKFLLNLQP
ncbi:MAG: aldehyde dehydrogenase [Bacteroidales bacterium]|nr:aldehyde dehydrogenase [Bacteroidales bacterium]